MDLIKRANIPDGFQQFLKYDSLSKRWEPPKNSFYIFKRSKSKSRLNQLMVTVNCYKKSVQLQEQHLPINNERINNTIRFEVQCHYDKVYQITQSKGLSRSGFAQFLSEDLSNDILHRYYKKTIGYGDYFTLNQAKILIQNSRVKQEKKKMLVEVVVLVNAKRGIWKARSEAQDKTTFDECIKLLHKLNINPVTIPIAWKIDFLPNLMLGL